MFSGLLSERIRDSKVVQLKRNVAWDNFLSEQSSGVIQKLHGQKEVKGGRQKVHAFSPGGALCVEKGNLKSELI